MTDTAAAPEPYPGAGDALAPGTVDAVPGEPLSAEMSAQRLMMYREELYQGPLPHPEMLERYKAVDPDAPRIIFRTFESQAKHRMEMEATYLHGSERRARIGQFLGTGIVLAVVGVGLVAVLTGQAGVGVGIIGLALAGGMLSYIFGDRPRRPPADSH